MPEYLTPGVFVKVRSDQGQAIEGVSTTITGFIGPCTFGPIESEPILVTSLQDYEGIYGSSESLEFVGNETADFMSHAVKLYFENGGEQLLITRVFEPRPDQNIEEAMACRELLLDEPTSVSFRARYPGRMGNQSIQVRAIRSENLVIAENQDYRIRNLSHGDLVEVSKGPAGDELIAPGSLTRDRLRCVLTDESGNASLFTLDGEPFIANLPEVSLHRITLSMEVMMGEEQTKTFIELSTHPAAPRFLGNIFYSKPDQSFSVDDPWPPPIEFVTGLNGERKTCLAFAGKLLLELINLPDQQLNLRDGHDGTLPGSEAYRGVKDNIRPTGLEAMRRATDMSVLAAPCLAALPTNREQNAIRQLLVKHCEQLCTCFAVLSGPLDGSLEDIRDTREQLDSKFAAIYYPSLVTKSSNGYINVPPDGAIAGIYVKNRVDKSLLNKVIAGITRTTVELDESQFDLLNSEQINCLMDTGRMGIRVLGTHTLSSDPLWRHVDSSRVFIFIQESIKHIASEFAFQPNTAGARAALSNRIKAFLNVQYNNGLLPANKHSYVKVDFDQDRMLCEMGIVLQGSNDIKVIVFPID